METLINKNKVLLDRYYVINNQFARMALKEPRFHDILSFLEELIHKPVSLLKDGSQKYISENFESDDFYIAESTKLSKKLYTNFEYHRKFVIYRANPKQQQSQLCVEIPSLGEEVYQLIIHELDQVATEKDFMAIENTVNFLQMEILKKYAVQQQNQSHLNEIINDLIYGRYHTEDELSEILNYLDFNEKDIFNLVILDFYEESNIKKEKWEDSASIAKSLANYIKKSWRKFVSLAKKDKVILLISNSDHDRIFKEKITSAINSFTSLSRYSCLSFNTAISDKANVFDLPVAAKQANSILKLLKQTNNKDKIISYKDLGVIQLFLETDNIENILKFVPDKILEIQKSHSELYKTLKVFLDHNQNYKTTAEQLFIHPKTAKYRIERVIQLAKINLENPEELLQINVGVRILDFIKMK